MDLICENEKIKTNQAEKCSTFAGWTLQHYWNISNRLVPFKTDFIRDFNESLISKISSDNHKTIVQKLSAIIHPFSNKYRAILKTNSEKFNLKLSLTNLSQEYSDEEQSRIFVSIIGSDLIKTMNHSLDYDKLNVLDEIQAQKNVRIEILKNQSECFQYENCFDCLTNVACLWQFTKQKCSNKNDVSITESVIHPSQCLTCESIQNCLMCNSLPKCNWKQSKCNSLLDSSTNVQNSECCEHFRNFTECFHQTDCLWCDRSKKCVSKTSKFFVDYELCEDFNVQIELREMNNCPLKCAHGRCQKHSELKCVCELGWTGKLCDRDCLCNFHSSCDIHGVGHCDKCRHSTTGQRCERCRPGFYGNASTTSGCYPCHCNGHGSAERGLCHPETGQCYCVPGTEGKHCERCSIGHFGDARDGGKCFVQCSTRTIVTGLQSGVRYFGLHPKQPRNQNIDCVWIVSANSDSISESEEFLGTKNIRSKNKPILVRLFPSNLSNNCSSSRIFIFDGIPESIAGSKLYHNRYLPGVCDGTSQTEFLSTSGFATIILSSSAALDALNGSVELYHTNTPVHSFPAIVVKTLWRKQIDSMFEPTLLTSINDTLMFLHSNSDSMKITSFNTTTLEFIPCDMIGISISDLRYFAVVAKTPKNVFIFGGLSSDSFVDTNQLLQLKFTSNCKVNVTKIEQTDPPKGLFGHTLTFISKNRALLIGGYSMKNGFNSQVFMLNFKNYKWEIVETSGATPPAILGHSSHYSSSEDSLYVFGGKQLNDAHKFVISNSMSILNIKQKYWSRVTASSFRAPIARYLHSSSTTFTHFYIGGESSVLWAYSFICKQWSKMQIGRTKHIGPFHVTDKYFISIVERKWMVAIALNSDVKPEPIVHCFDDEDMPHCSNYGNCIDCLTHSECHWCSACARRQGECVSRTESCDRYIINQFSRTQICSNVTIKQLDKCSSRHCQAADCYSCQSMKECSWFHVTQLSPWLKANQFHTSDSMWNCVPTPHISNVLDEFFSSTNNFTTQTCARRCNEISDCEQCLHNEANDCVWAPSMRRCLTRAVSELACTTGQCGRVLATTSYSQCPLDCSDVRRPTECIQTMACGWCQLNSTFGYCTYGGLLSSASEQCEGKWHYLTLPKGL